MKNKHQEHFQGSSILICGGSGFYGSNFVEYCLENDLFEKICILSRNEYVQSQLRNKLDEKYGEDTKRVRFLIGDITDKSRLDYAFRGIDYVINAASYKRIETVFFNVEEAIKVNILGQINVAKACVEQNIKKCIYIGTDKGKHPLSNVPYGLMKALSVHFTTYFNSGHSTKFSNLLWGNVFCSSGSVVEYFLKEKSNQFKITHKDMTRFFVDVEDVIELTLMSLISSRGGETSFPKMKSAYITDLATAINPNKKIVFIGSKIPEKMEEQLIEEVELERIAYKDGYYVILPLKSFDNNGLYEEYEKYIVKDLKMNMFVSNTAEKFKKEELKNMVEKWRKKLNV